MQTLETLLQRTVCRDDVHEELLRLSEALTELPDSQRDAIILRHLQGLSMADVAQELGRTETTIAGRRNSYVPVIAGNALRWPARACGRAIHAPAGA